MTEFTVKLAGIPIRVQALYSETKELCKDYLCDEEERFQVVVRPEDLDFERNKSGQVSTQNYPGAYLESLALYRQIAEKMLAYDVLLFHGSAISVDGEAYLFTAKSGTGKSTHTRFWREYFGERALMVNDDKPLLRIRDTGISVCGTPWDGKHHLSTPVELPLRAIIILERDQENHIEEISIQDAFPVLWRQCYHSENPVKLEKILSMLERIGNQTDLYRLGCNMDPKAAEIAYNGMQKNYEE